MPRYRVLAKSFINNTIVQEGDVVDFDGTAGSNLEPYEPARRGRSSGPETSGPDAAVAAEPLEEHLT